MYDVYVLAENKQFRIGQFLSYGLFSITIFLFNGIAYDPVNLPKLVLLVPIAGLCLGILLPDIKMLFSTANGFFSWLILIFMVSAFVSLIFGRSPTVLNFYGGAGRNTGTLTYICLAVLALSASMLSKNSYANRVLYSFFAAGIFNLLYGLLVIASGKDPYPWNNTFGTILGTFGNPNFISAFLGMNLVVTLAFTFKSSLSLAWKYFLLSSIPLYLFLIVESRSLQGLVVVGIGTLIITFLLIRNNFGRKVQLFFGILAFILGVACLLGMLQKGPLQSILYKSSVSIRGQYWHAGLNMFRESPLFGIGLDSYGDWFRRMRNESATILPGLDTVTDSAHNVFIDILSGGGLFMFIPYILIQILVLQKALRFLKNRKTYDNIFTALFVGWVTYLAQSLISINQIGLAIWGWIFPALILSYIKFSNENPESLPAKRRNTNSRIKKDLSPSNFLILVAVTSLSIITIWPIAKAENAWKQSLKSKDAQKIIEATNKWPQTNLRFATTMNIFAKSNAPVESLEVARLSSKFNPDFFDAWNFIFAITGNETEKLNAKKNLHRLDPLNPKYK